MTSEGDYLTGRAMLAALAGYTYRGQRDIYQAFGYNRRIRAADYRARYARGGIAQAIVDAYPNAVWRGVESVLVGEDPAPRLDALAEELDLWSTLHRAHRIAGIVGTAGVILTGQDNSMPLREGGQVLRLDVWGCDYLTFNRSRDGLDEDGMPAQYRLSRSGLLSGLAVGEGTQTIHGSRVILVNEGWLEDRLIGRPALESVWNLLDDLEKVVGAMSEGFFRAADPGLVLKMPKADWRNDTVLDRLYAKVQDFIHRLRRQIPVPEGTEVETLSAQIPSDGPALVDAIMGLIASTKRIPRRILEGSERGELASSQDRLNFASQVEGLREDWAVPRVARPILLRLAGAAGLGVAGAIGVQWEDPGENLGARERVEVARELQEIGLFSMEEIRRAAGYPPRLAEGEQPVRAPAGMDDGGPEPPEPPDPEEEE